MSNPKNVRTSRSLKAPHVLTVRDASALLNVNVKTLYAEISSGRFPAIRLGRAIRISRSVVMSTLERGRIAMARPERPA